MNQLRAGWCQIMGKAYEVFTVSLKQRVRASLPLECPLHDLVRGQLSEVSINADSFSFGKLLYGMFEEAISFCRKRKDLAFTLRVVLRQHAYMTIKVAVDRDNSAGGMVRKLCMCFNHEEFKFINVFNYFLH